jgi:hypothetical protein
MTTGRYEVFHLLKLHLPGRGSFECYEAIKNMIIITNAFYEMGDDHFCNQSPNYDG